MTVVVDNKEDTDANGDGDVVVVHAHQLAYHSRRNSNVSESGFF